MFDVGQLVVCVDDGCGRAMGEVLPIRRTSVYTIAETIRWPSGDVVDLVEAPHPQAVAMRMGIAPALYAASRFRPLKDSALDVFRQALEPAPKQTEPA